MATRHEACLPARPCHATPWPPPPPTSANSTIRVGHRRAATDERRHRPLPMHRTSTYFTLQRPPEGAAKAVKAEHKTHPRNMEQQLPWQPLPTFLGPPSSLSNKSITDRKEIQTHHKAKKKDTRRDTSPMCNGRASSICLGCAPAISRSICSMKTTNAEAPAFCVFSPLPSSPFVPPPSSLSSLHSPGHWGTGALFLFLLPSSHFTNHLPLWFDSFGFGFCFG